MTQDEIIEMAIKAGFVEYELDDGTTNAFDRRYAAFAQLVEGAAFKRWAAQTKFAIQDEREACAKICDKLQDDIATEPKHCAESIRARGKA